MHTLGLLQLPQNSVCSICSQVTFAFFDTIVTSPAIGSPCFKWLSDLGCFSILCLNPGLTLLFIPSCIPPERGPQDASFMPPLWTPHIVSLFISVVALKDVKL